MGTEGDDSHAGRWSVHRVGRGRASAARASDGMVKLTANLPLPETL
jgi:hypothetical protein